MDKKIVVRWELGRYLSRKRITQQSFGEMCTPQMDRHQVNKLTKAKTISFEKLEIVMNALNMKPDEMGELIKVYEVKE
ncbi:hypothetical protein EYB33_19865 [Lysinibacillus sphaericus]|uniref:hypothetical protein n=1 Tax=Lysinibacillus sphaericus TaxID=1421 RepID=UPI001E3D2320|nr:hypothetical protein [Lysinibacillus sphaericus]UDK98385.1 hypothetical protein EYB33_19865 [Lysinibacillus sphaericus]